MRMRWDSENTAQKIHPTCLCRLYMPPRTRKRCKRRRMAFSTTFSKRGFSKLAATGHQDDQDPQAPSIFQLSSLRSETPTGQPSPLSTRTSCLAEVKGIQRFT